MKIWDPVEEVLFNTIGTRKHKQGVWSRCTYVLLKDGMRKKSVLRISGLPAKLAKWWTSGYSANRQNWSFNNRGNLQDGQFGHNAIGDLNTRGLAQNHGSVTIEHVDK